MAALLHNNISSFPLSVCDGTVKGLGLLGGSVGKLGMGVGVGLLAPVRVGGGVGWLAPDRVGGGVGWTASDCFGGGVGRAASDRFGSGDEWALGTPKKLVIPLCIPSLP